jgi:hypothetical protein
MKTIRKSRRPGLTSIELLTVGGIALLLAALAMPSLLQARQAARSNRCTNNLKQLGLALHNYHDAYGTFPAGWYARTEKAAEGPFWGWQYSILPYLEEAPLFNEIDPKQPVPEPNETVTKRIELYICPANLEGVVNDIRGGYGVSSYSGNHGNERLPGSADTPTKANGIFYWNSSVRIAHITDGTSVTFMVGERGLDSAAGIWPGVRANQHENDAVTDCSDHARINSDITGFSSMHGKAAYFLMCDGAVRFFNQDIESRPPGGGLGIYQKLSQRDDGQVLPGF